jgi:hypothetical protein
MAIVTHLRKLEGRLRFHDTQLKIVWSLLVFVILLEVIKVIL